MVRPRRVDGISGNPSETFGYSPGVKFLRTPIQLIAVAASCGLTLTLLPFLALFEVQHPPYLMEWRTFVLALCAYEMLAPVLVGIVASRILPGREWALALIFTSVYTLAGMPRLLGDALFDVILPEALSWMSLWTITTFGAACLVMRRSQGGSPQLSLRRRG